MPNKREPVINKSSWYGILRSGWYEYIFCERIIWIAILVTETVWTSKAPLYAPEHDRLTGVSDSLARYPFSTRSNNSRKGACVTKLFCLSSRLRYCSLSDSFKPSIKLLISYSVTGIIFWIVNSNWFLWFLVPPLMLWWPYLWNKDIAYLYYFPIFGRRQYRFYLGVLRIDMEFHFLPCSW